MHEGFIEQAIAEAERGVASRDGGPFGAVVVQDGEVIGRGHNCVTSRCDPTAHAEVVAIRDACAGRGSYSLQGATLYSSCEPCPMCLCASYWARVDRIYFAASGAEAAAAGFDDEVFHRELRRPPEKRSLLSERIVHPRSQAPFDAWLALADRLDY